MKLNPTPKMITFSTGQTFNYFPNLGKNHIH